MRVTVCVDYDNCDGVVVLVGKRNRGGEERLNGEDV